MVLPLARVPELSVILPNGIVFQHTLYQLESELGAFSVGTLHEESAPHEFQKLSCDVESQAGPLYGAVPPLLYPLIFIKEPFHILGMYAYTGILHRHPKPHCILRTLFSRT